MFCCILSRYILFGLSGRYFDVSFRRWLLVGSRVSYGGFWDMESVLAASPIFVLSGSLQGWCWFLGVLFFLRLPFFCRGRITLAGKNTLVVVK